jgi:ferredoxin
MIPAAQAGGFLLGALQSERPATNARFAEGNQDCLAIAVDVKAVIAEQLRVSEDKVKRSAYLVDDLGADPPHMVKLVKAFEEKYKIKIPDDEAKRFKKVGDVVDYIMSVEKCDLKYYGFVIAEPCIGSTDTACVDVCPVDCIHPRRDEPDFKKVPQLYINPAECIECGECVTVCPVEAIFPSEDLPKKWGEFREINAQYYRKQHEKVRAFSPAGTFATRSFRVRFET